MKKKVMRAVTITTCDVCQAAIRRGGGNCRICHRDVCHDCGRYYDAGIYDGQAVYVCETCAEKHGVLAIAEQVQDIRREHSAAAKELVDEYAKRANAAWEGLLGEVDK